MKLGSWKSLTFFHRPDHHSCSALVRSSTAHVSDASSYLLLPLSLLSKARSINPFHFQMRLVYGDNQPFLGMQRWQSQVGCPARPPLHLKSLFCAPRPRLWDTRKYIVKVSVFVGCRASLGGSSCFVSGDRGVPEGDGLPVSGARCDPGGGEHPAYKRIHCCALGVKGAAAAAVLSAVPQWGLKRPCWPGASVLLN